MKITNEKTEKRQAYLTIEMEPAELEDGLSRAYNRLVRKYNVPGFRKGKTPRPILEQYIGKAALLEDAVEHMAPEAYEKAVKEQDLKPLAQPHIDLDKVDPVTYKMVVPLEPTVKLGEYHQVKLKPESIELKEEDINAAIEVLRHQHAVWEPVERQVNSRDSVTLDIESHVGAQPYINQKDAEYQVEKESEFPMKGFSEELIGMKRGETKEFKLIFPQDYSRAELAGKEAEFKVTVKEIKQERLPEVNDDFAKQVNAEFKNVEDLRNKVSESLKKANEEKTKRDFEQKVVDEVVKQSEIEYPPVMEEAEIDSLIRDQMRRWQVDEKGMDEYLKSIKRTPEQLREELRPVAERMVKQTLVLTEVARAEDVQVNQNDVKEYVESMTKDIEPERKDTYMQLLSLPQSQANIASSIATRRVIERLTEIAQSPAEEGAKAQTTGDTAAAKPVESEETKAENKTEVAEAKEAEAKEKEA
jgi:trigger factor